jgi:hypothetical protein
MKVSITSQNSSMKDVINEIEEQTDYLFLYNQDEIDLNRQTSINASNTKVSDLLIDLFAETNIKYVMVGHNIVLMKRDQTIAQQSGKQVQGTVTDEQGEPIIGANVVVKGTMNGTVTDLDGRFSLEVSGNDVLVVSYIGYKTKEISIKGLSNVEISIMEDMESLDEVVVIGYGTVKRKDFTGSVSSIKLEDSPVALATNLNALESIKGNVAGLDIGATNSAGGQPSMQMRGQKSISGSVTTQVVFVI